MIRFNFDNSYARDLPGFYVAWQPATVPSPRLLFLNRPLAGELGLDAAALEGGQRNQPGAAARRCLVAVRASGAADIRRSSVAMEWRDFTGLPLVCLPADNPVQRLVDAQLSASEVLPGERHEFENMHTVLAMCEAGMGYSVLPAFIQPSAQRYRVASHPLTRPQVTCGFYEITKKGRPVNCAVARFTACLKEALLQTC